MASKLRSAGLAIVLFLSISLPAFAGCDSFCSGRYTINEHCTDIVGGQGDMTDCSDYVLCGWCADYYTGDLVPCCEQSCRGHVCLLG